MTEPVVQLETEGPATILTIHRPQALNAINAEVIDGLNRALDQVSAESRGVILTGSGNKAFVAGADIKAMMEMSADQAEGFSRAGHDLAARLEALSQPVIAAVNGFALGGGCELMLACDFALASTNARFGQPEVALGVIPGFGGTTRLVRRIGVGMARQLLVTGEQIDANRAAVLGLVNEVVEPDQLRSRALALVDAVARNAPRAVALAKRSARVAEESDLHTANQFEMAAFGLCFATDDQKEGMQAFVEKRRPSWKS